LQSSKLHIRKSYVLSRLKMIYSSVNLLSNIDAISIGLDISSTVVLNTTADVKCFNYTLQSSFSSLPQVAVGNY